VTTRILHVSDLHFGARDDPILERGLTTLIERRSPLNGSVTLTDAPAISCNGWIAANGFDNTTLVKHAYLLIPRDRADGDRDRDDKDCRRR